MDTIIQSFRANTSLEEQQLRTLLTQKSSNHQDGRSCHQNGQGRHKQIKIKGMLHGKWRMQAKRAGHILRSGMQEVHTLENAIDHIVTNEVQQSNVIDSTSVYMEHDSEWITNAMLIQNRNKTEENLKKELHSVKLKLNSTMENNKIFEETVTTLKHKFKQKESKFLTDFSNLKHLNNKLENKLHSQDQSIQTVHMMLNPTQVYDQKTKTALGAQNPCYIRQDKKAQPTLYDGDELLKPHHVPVIVPSSEEELELAEATRNKLHVKMNDSACVEKRAEELKTNTPPLPVLPHATVYPPNTPVHLVPRTLPTTSQVNSGLYVITQLFWDFEKTCKKRITPTGITEGERGFEQTKRCYLTEAIPFFNLLKEHFDSVQRSLVTKVRAMKAVFEIWKRKWTRMLAENAKVKQHYKKLYDSIKITRAKTTDQNNSLLSEIENLNSKCVTIPDSKPKVLAPGRYPIDVELISPRHNNNREAHLHYIKHLKESVEILRKIVEDAKVERPLDTSLASAWRYTKHSLELLEYVIGTCPKDFSPRDKQNASTNSLRKNQVSFVEPYETLIR
ncbi:hypothetical protein Tco_1360021 [Tanacetum coccineum]